jgi:F-type H+-transporting ATPase subunit b
MLINWFTVGAQILNFLILVWLLKRFLYKPVLGAIDAREKRIAAELADADAKKAEARKESDEFQAKNKAFDEQRASLLAKAEGEARAEGERLAGEARKEADALRGRQDAALRGDRSRLAGEITRMARDEVFEIARKALSDLATVSLEERIGEVFTRRLREMDAKAKAQLAAAIRTSTAPAVVRSTFDVGPAQRAAIQNALNEEFSANVPVRFETSKETICGIEMTANGQRVAWSIAGYLASLEEKVGSLVDSQPLPAAAAPTPDPKPSEKPAAVPRPTAQPAPDAKPDEKPAADAKAPSGSEAHLEETLPQKSAA